VLSVDFRDEKLHITVIKGPDFSEDLHRLKEISGRHWNGKTWELPWFQLINLADTFKKDELLFKAPILSQLQERLKESLVPWHFAGSNLQSIEFARHPKPYQERYIRIARTRRRLLCAFEQGCGKTFSSLERARVTGTGRLLVISPKVVCANWRTEIRSVMKQEAIIYQGTKSKRAKQLELIKTSTTPVICTYETAREVSDGIASGAFSCFDQIIIDEAHLLSNPESKRFKDVLQLVRLNKHCAIQCLTGTPMQHRIKDIWAILFILNPLIAGGYEAFKKQFMQPVRWMNKAITLREPSGKPKLDEKGKPQVVVKQIEIAWKPRNLHILTERLDAISYRVRREDVTTFSDVMDTVTVELTHSQRELYEKLKHNIVVEMDSREFSLRHLPVRLLRLLQAAEGVFNFDPSDWDSGKLEYIRHILDNTSEKMIVWSRFRPITEILGQIYADKSVVYNGSRSDSYKQFAKWSFNGVTDPKDLEEFHRIRDRHHKIPVAPGWAQYFFGTVDMRSSLGMDLHTDCSQQIFSSFSWMGAANMQAADRLRRIGQRSQRVRTDFLVGEDTFEFKALEIVMRNFQDTIKALDGSEKMSYRQIQEITDLLRKGGSKIG